MIEIHIGDCRQVLKTLPDASVNCCVTSPPYWGLRDYGVDGQVGLEADSQEFIGVMVDVFREVRRVLRNDGTLWLNMGDAYNAAGRNGHGTRIGPKQQTNRASAAGADEHRQTVADLKPKDLIGMPWRLAFALQSDGWYLRTDIIWAKGNCMPESVKDRPTRCHEYIFLMAKEERYYYDADAIKVPASPDTHARYARGRSSRHKHADGGPGKQTIAKSFEHMKRRAGGVHPKAADPGSGIKANRSFCEAVRDVVDMRNKRTVWHVNSKGFSGAHFATFPPDLIRPCILAGCPVRGTVLDPFGGAGTTALVAEEEGRNSVLIELNPEYAEIANNRTRQLGLFCAVLNKEVTGGDSRPVN